MFCWSSHQSDISVTGNIQKTFAKVCNVRNNKGVLKKNTLGRNYSWIKKDLKNT